MRRPESLHNNSIADKTNLSVKNQICVALYQNTHKITRLYGTLLDPYGLSFTQYQLLLALWENEGCTVGTLCAVLNLETSTVTPALKRLESLGFATRCRDRMDERRVNVSLTEKGIRFEEEARVLRCRLIDSLGPEAIEIADLLPLLHKLSSLIDRANGTLDCAAHQPATRSRIGRTDRQ